MCSRCVPKARLFVQEYQKLKGNPQFAAQSMPGAGFEPATFGLQNRCTTTVLTRRLRVLTRTLAFFANPRFRILSGSYFAAHEASHRKAMSNILYQTLGYK